MSLPVLIIVAFDEEKKVVQSLIENPTSQKKNGYEVITGGISGVPVELVMSSMGHQAAQKTAEAMVHEGSCQRVLVLGFCGGLHPNLKEQDLVLATSVCFDGEEHITKGVKLEIEGISLKSAKYYCSQSIVENPQDKVSLYKAHGTEAVDMESFPIVKRCQQQNVNCVVAKVVIDGVDLELPHFNAHMEGKGPVGEVHLDKVLLQTDLGKKLVENMKKGSVVLGKAVPGLVAGELV